MVTLLLMVIIIMVSSDHFLCLCSLYSSTVIFKPLHPWCNLINFHVLHSCMWVLQGVDIPICTVFSAKRTWLHGFTSHLKVQTCTKQGTVVAGFTAAWQVSSGTALSLPWMNWTQDTVLCATPRAQDTEQGDVAKTFHLDGLQWQWDAVVFGEIVRVFMQECLNVIYLAGQLLVLHETTAVGLGESPHSVSSTTTSSPSVSRAQYSTLLATPPPHVTLQTPCLERHLLVENILLLLFCQWSFSEISVLTLILM